MTEFAAALLHRLDDELPVAGDPARAAAMAAYMRGQFPFLGLPAPALRARERAVLAGLPAPSEDDLRVVALGCWQRAEREFQYFACDYLRRHVSVPGADFLPVLRTLITTKPWWDTVDLLATGVVGRLVKRYPATRSTMDEWSRADDKWLVRTAILHQLHHGAQTDTERLFDYCSHQAQHHDFFVRKAIGWALRHYARTDADAVRHFLSDNRDRLSPLSVREASKHL